MKLMWAALSLAWLCAACAPQVVPPELDKEVTAGLSLAQVRENPDMYIGKTVLWGGRIIKAINKKKGTLVEVLEHPLDSDRRPRRVDESQGRFIVAMHGYLETFIYNHGREVTAVGEVSAVKKLPVGEFDYTYVLLRGKELKLWPERVRRPAPDWGPPAWGFYAGPGPYWYNGPYLWW